MLRLCTRWFGVLLLDAGGRAVDERLFPKDAGAIAARMARVQRGELLEEERELGARAGGAVAVSDARLLAVPGATPLAAPIVVEGASRGFDDALYREAMLRLARDRAREALAGRDRHLVQAVATLDDLADVANALAERLREWYGLHFPELADRVERHEEFAALVSAHVTREAIAKADPRWAPLLPDSIGAALGEREAQAARDLARALSTLYDTRGRIERYLEAAMPEMAPNLSAVAGAALGARLIALAGGLSQLASMSGGTIQILGAEKAIFRHLREGKAPPKHGAIFVHPLVHRAPRHQRGAMARALSNKIAVAARADAFTGADVRSDLAAALDKRVAEVRRTRASPTRRPPRRGPPRTGGR